MTDTSPCLADRVLVVMAKAPRAGRVKTRLSSKYPVTVIVELYRCLLADTLTLGLSIPNTQLAVMAPPEDLDEVAALLPAGVRGIAQHGTGLADALASVFDTFTADRPRRVIAFNSDSPHLPASVLDDAFAVLLTHDLVAGPTEDGGYYLVGATAPHATLFDPCPLSTSGALAALLANARSKDLTYRLTREWFDVDVASDLARLAAALRLNPSAAPRTAAHLHSWSDRATSQVAPVAGSDVP